ncbi:hypothetical protein QTN25_007377 [Entamoeba marina]
MVDYKPILFNILNEQKLLIQQLKNCKNNDDIVILKKISKTFIQHTNDIISLIPIPKSPKLPKQPTILKEVVGHKQNFHKQKNTKQRRVISNQSEIIDNELNHVDNVNDSSSLLQKYGPNDIINNTKSFGYGVLKHSNTIYLPIEMSLEATKKYLNDLKVSYMNENN